MKGELAALAWEWIKRASPACAALVLVATVSMALYAESRYSTKTEIQQGFTVLGARMDLSDAQNTVRDLQGQIRAKEREIADLEMVILEMGPMAGDSANVLRSRAFTSRQDLAELQSRLSSAQSQQIEAARRYQQTMRAE